MRLHFPLFPFRHRGVSLIELMIAMVLGLLLIAGIIQLFTGTRMTYLSNEGLARVQENGRFALEMLRQPARQAISRGFCGSDTRIRNHLNIDLSGGSIPAHIFNPIMSISGWEFANTGPGDNVTIDALGTGGNWSASDQSGTGTVVIPPEIANVVLSNTDVLLLRTMQPITGVTADPIGGSGPTTAHIALDLSARPDGLALDGNDILLVTDCSYGDLFQNGTSGDAVAQLNRGGDNPGNIPLDSGNPETHWRTPHDGTMQVFRPIIHFYYVALNTVGEPALFRLNLSNGSGAGAAEELVQGVENMQLLFGYSLPGGDGQSVDHWLTAAQVPDWRLITAAHIALLVRSPDSAGGPGQAQTFDLAGTNVTVSADPQRLRHAVQTTVGLRNRYIVNE